MISSDNLGLPIDDTARAYRETWERMAQGRIKRRAEWKPTRREINAIVELRRGGLGWRAIGPMFGVSYQTAAKRAKAEGWMEMREQPNER